MEVRQCHLCKMWKDASEEFYWTDGKPRSKCKECHKQWVNQWRKQNLANVKKFREKHWYGGTATPKLDQKSGESVEG